MKRSAVFAGLLLLCFPCNSLLNPVAWGQAAAPGTQQSLSAPATTAPMNRSRIRIPGPLLAFLRMAAISQKTTPEEVLPFLARNVVVEGYQYWQDKARKPTEFLKLLKDYLQQARELQTLAGSEGVLRVTNCAEADRLGPGLGFPFRTPSRPGPALETADPE